MDISARSRLAEQASRRTLAGGLVIAVILVVLGAGSLAGQTTKASTATNGNSAKWTHSKTAWGDPDLQGIWTTDDEIDVPVERPREFGTRAVLTDQEVAARAAEEARRARDDKSDRRPLREGQTGDGPEHWYEQPKTTSHRTSLITDPPDGRIPPFTAEGAKRAAKQQSLDSGGTGPWNGPEDLGLRERCMTRGVPNTWFPSAYNNGFQIVQSRGYVSILYERLHEARIIPLDGRPHANPRVRQWIGDSRGHWDGTTLVVDVTNFSEKAQFRGAGDNLHLVERYTRTGADTIQVEFTVEDPTTWARPWTAVVHGRHDPSYWQIFEYACHEGNYGMFNILSGARAKERDAEGVAPKKAGEK
jgi:hypothetical protein